MDHYIDIRVIENPDFQDTILLNELFSCLHIALVELGDGTIGVSFPNVDKTLGSILRLHGSSEPLRRLMSINWFKRLNDFVSLSEILPIPKVVNYRVVKRVQSKSNSERLLRRSIRKGWVTEAEASLKLDNAKNQMLSLPYLRMKSMSSGHKFLLFIEHSSIITNPIPGIFNAYGLSTNTTIPWF